MRFKLLLAERSFLANEKSDFVHVQKGATLNMGFLPLSPPQEPCGPQGTARMLGLELRTEESLKMALGKISLKVLYSFFLKIKQKKNPSSPLNYPKDVAERYFSCPQIRPDTMSIIIES